VSHYEPIRDFNALPEDHPEAVVGWIGVSAFVLLLVAGVYVLWLMGWV
jgi:hypothetical protein